ncbi:MAG: TIGR01777 family protein [Chloroflexi bacterium RBG_13_52_14]|nr:MAG: TIGR01777 family protein [Chloroflexi bacterium RBG_13_52_14]
MKILISGGTGFIGNILTPKFIQHGHEVTVLARSMDKGRTLPKGVEVILCDTTKPGTWQTAVAQHDAVINLAGTSIFRRWNRKGKQEILDSRTISTKNIVEALAERRSKATRFLNASGVGYYGFRGDEIVNESNSPGNDFLAQVAQQWESVAASAGQFGASVVLCRMGHVLGRNGGVMERLTMITKLCLGSQWGNGLQWVSWIHESDLADIYLFLLEHREIEGPVNVTAPEPVRNKDMMMVLRQHLKRRSILPRVPSFVLKLIAGEFSSVFLNGQRAVPQILLARGYTFKYPAVSEALHELLGETGRD